VSQACRPGGKGLNGAPLGATPSFLWRLGIRREGEQLRALESVEIGATGQVTGDVRRWRELLPSELIEPQVLGASRQWIPWSEPKRPMKRPHTARALVINGIVAEGTSATCPTDPSVRAVVRHPDALRHSPRPPTP
jgi:hypothetical protein